LVHSLCLWPSRSLAQKAKAAPFEARLAETFVMSNLFLHRQHTIRFAATPKVVAVSKGEAKSVGVHDARIVV
jgi:hypothetical protein